MSSDEYYKEFNKKRIADFYKLMGKEDENGCMPFLGKKNKAGYGTYQITTIDGAIIKGAHRVAYYIANNNIDQNLLVCHSCDNPSCCNPDHLFLGTHKDNAKDSVNKGRHVGMNGKKHSDETKRKISIKTAGANNGMYGKKHSNGSKSKMSISHKKRFHDLD